MTPFREAKQYPCCLILSIFAGALPMVTPLCVKAQSTAATSQSGSGSEQAPLFPRDATHLEDPTNNIPVVVPKGTEIRIMLQLKPEEANRAGNQGVVGVVTADVKIGELVAIPRGTQVLGSIAPAGHLSGAGVFKLQELSIGKQTYSMSESLGIPAIRTPGDSKSSGSLEVSFHLSNPISVVTTSALERTRLSYALDHAIPEDRAVHRQYSPVYGDFYSSKENQ